MRTEPIIPRGTFIMILLIGIIMAGAALGIYKVSNSTPLAQVQELKEYPELYVPQHLYVNGVANVCVDKVTDLVDYQATVSFSFSAGAAVSAVFRQPNGARCVQYRAPAKAQLIQVNAYAFTPLLGANMTAEFRVIKDQF